MLRRLLLIAWISCASALGCSSGGADDGAAGGTAGAQPQAGAAGEQSNAGAAGAGGDSCAGRGGGRIEVRITGLPDGVDAGLIVGGPNGSEAVTSDRTLEVAAGRYLATPSRVAVSDPIVRTLYDVEINETSFCLAEDATFALEVQYSPIVPSHHLWTNNSNGSGNLLGFTASSLAGTGDVEPELTVLAGAGKDVTFDSDGNLWSMGATLADPHLMLFSRGAFALPDSLEATAGIEIEGVACLPAMRAFAFDRAGALWVSVCGDRVVSLSPEQLSASGSVAPGIVIDGVTENGDLAFDILGNLWVTSDTDVVRYDAARLAASITSGPDLRLSMRASTDDRSIVPSNLAFDLAGNLWVIDFGGNLVSKIASADLAATGAQSVVAAVTITLGVAALLERPAFDESAGLWLALDQNRFGRLSAAQLDVSTGAGEPTVPETVITSPNMGNANRMALFPAPAGLPLYHSFP
jgi:hypothetical protein